MKREDIVIKKGKKKFKTAPPETGVIQVTSLLNTNLYDFHELIARCLVGIEVESGIEYETFDKVVAKYHEPEDCNYSWEGIELSTKLKGGYGSYGYGIEEFFDYIINGYQSEYKSKSVDIEENVSDLAKRLWAYSEAQFYDVTEHTLEEMQFLSESHARKILTDIQKYDAEIYALEQYMANEMKVLIEKLYEEGTKPKTSAERFLNDIVKSRIEDLKLQKIMQMEESTCNFYLHCYELLGRDPIYQENNHQVSLQLIKYLFNIKEDQLYRFEHLVGPLENDLHEYKIHMIKKNYLNTLQNMVEQRVKRYSELKEDLILIGESNDSLGKAFDAIIKSQNKKIKQISGLKDKINEEEMELKRIEEKMADDLSKCFTRAFKGDIQDNNKLLDEFFEESESIDEEEVKEGLLSFLAKNVRNMFGTAQTTLQSITKETTTFAGGYIFGGVFGGITAIGLKNGAEYIYSLATGYWKDYKKARDEVFDYEVERRKTSSTLLRNFGDEENASDVRNFYLKTLQDLDKTILFLEQQSDSGDKLEELKELYSVILYGWKVMKGEAEVKNREEYFKVFEENLKLIYKYANLKAKTCTDTMFESAFRMLVQPCVSASSAVLMATKLEEKQLGHEKNPMLMLEDSPKPLTMVVLDKGKEEETESSRELEIISNGPLHHGIVSIQTLRQDMSKAKMVMGHAKSSRDEAYSGCLEIAHLIKRNTGVLPTQKDVTSGIHDVMDKIQPNPSVLDWSTPIKGESYLSDILQRYVTDEYMKDVIYFLKKTCVKPILGVPDDKKTLTIHLNDNHDSLLHLICRNQDTLGFLEIAQYLERSKIPLTNVFDLTARNKQGLTFLDVAAQTGNVYLMEEILRALEDGYQNDNINETALIELLAPHAPKPEKARIPWGISSYLTPNWFKETSAMWSEYTEVCKYSTRDMHSLEMIPHIANEDRYPFHHLVLTNTVNPLETLKRNSTQFKKLIDQLWHGRTPVYLAVEKDQVELVKWLYDHGADIANSGPNGASALTCAAKLQRNEIVQVLLSSFLKSWHGNLNRAKIEPATGRTCFHYIVEGCDREAVELYLDTLKTGQRSVEHHWPQDRQYGFNPMHLLVLRDDALDIFSTKKSALKKSVYQSTYLAKCNEFGLTPLQVAILAKKDDLALLIEEHMEYLKIPKEIILQQHEEIKTFIKRGLDKEQLLSMSTDKLGPFVEEIEEGMENIEVISHSDEDFEVVSEVVKPLPLFERYKGSITIEEVDDTVPEEKGKKKKEDKPQN